MNYHPEAVDSVSDPHKTNVSKIENVQLLLATQMRINEEKKATCRRYFDTLMAIKHICDRPPSGSDMGKVRLLINKWEINT
jgi:hypothetical protein